MNSHESIPDLNIQNKDSVTLYCEKSVFDEFISNLLGKPQKISKIYLEKSFSVNIEDIKNTYYLIEQRIKQQNDARLVAFTAIIYYNDRSSVTLNSLEDLVHYREIKPLISESIDLTWIYLIKFQNKNAPEKQQIDVRFCADTKNKGTFVTEDGVLIESGRYFGSRGFISVEISHTDRTWGADIESLLTNHINTLLISNSKIKEFINKHSEKISTLIGGTCLSTFIIGVLIAMNAMIGKYKSVADSYVSNSTKEIDYLIKKLDFLTEITINGVWPKFSLSVFSYIIFAIMVTIALMAWISSKASKRPISYVLLTKASEEYKIKSQKKIDRDWFLFSLSIILGIFTSLISNYIFLRFFTNM